MYDQVPPSVMQEFHKYDLDSSGFIDPLEFTNIAIDLNVDINAVGYPSSTLFPSSCPSFLPFWFSSSSLSPSFPSSLSYFTFLAIFQPQTRDKFTFMDSEMVPGKEAVVIKADLSPLQISSMTKFNKKESVSHHSAADCFYHQSSSVYFL